MAETQLRLPVFVWIHGGGFEIGAISVYTPEYILDEDVVLVTVQYRLGIFGFLSTNDEMMPGNQGLKDVRLSLRWIQENIHHFGGDPEKVTIGGHSAGAVLVHALMLFSSHEGLFRAGITMSGALLRSIFFKPPQEVMKAPPVLARLSSCPADSVGLVQCLRQKPAQELIELNKRIKLSFQTGIISGGKLPLFRPVIEPECVKDRIITDNPWTRVVTIPWIAGVNKLEGEVLLYDPVLDTSDILFSLTNKYYGDVIYNFFNYVNSRVDFRGIPEAIRSFYLNNRPISRKTYPELAQIITDAAFTYGVYEAILRGDLSRTFVYINEYISDQDAYTYPLPREYLIDTPHTSALTSLFPDIENVVPDRIYSEDDDAVSKRMVKLWINFVSNLNPGFADYGVRWNNFGCEQNYLNLTLESFYMKRGFFPKRMRFWQNVPYVYRDEILGPIMCC